MSSTPHSDQPSSSPESAGFISKATVDQFERVVAQFSAVVDQFSAYLRANMPPKEPWEDSLDDTNDPE